MGFESFEKDYETEEKELFVLLSEGSGSCKNNDFWVANAYFLAYVDIATLSLEKAEGSLVWPITDDEEEAGDYFGRFKNETIYRIKARMLIDRVVPKGMLPSFSNRFYVTEIIKENATCPALEELLIEYKKPVVLQDDMLGELILDKRYDVFDGEILWLGDKLRISLDTASNYNVTRARKSMRSMLESQEKWDALIRNFAAEKLTALANEWQKSNDESSPEITAEIFSKRIKLVELSMSSGGSFIVYCNDDDMFFGHCVTVYGTLKSGVKSAVIEG